MLEMIGTGVAMFTLGYVAARVRLIHYQQRAERALKECSRILTVTALALELEDRIKTDRSKGDGMTGHPGS